MILSFIRCSSTITLFFFNATAPTEIYTLSLHDALPICMAGSRSHRYRHGHSAGGAGANVAAVLQDRKSTRLNSSHVRISYAVFCLKKKNIIRDIDIRHNDSYADGDRTWFRYDGGRTAPA